MRYAATLMALLIAGSSLGQSFTPVASQHGLYHTYTGVEYGGGASFYDVNKDGWDDLTVMDHNDAVLLFLNINGSLATPIPVADCDAEPKSICWVDYDNDGDADLFLTHYNGLWKLYQNTGSFYSLEDVTEAAGLGQEQTALTFGQSWGDYDRDGDLDLYIANYNNDGVTNAFYQNQGDGTFVDISASTVVNNESNYSFNGVFIDYNQDLWPDLFVINDRFPSDNALYLNQNGAFTDVTQETGVGHNIYSMNNSWADYDRDGDMDVYVSNNPNGNLLLQCQENDTFLEVAAEAGAQVFDHSWSANWIDFNLDGYEDLHVACSEFWGQEGQNRMLINNQDGTFTTDILSTGLVNDDHNSHTTVAGDLNNDGFFDLFVQNDAPTFSRLYLCTPDGNTNNYLKVGLTGVASNKDGIGSWISIWCDGGKQIRYTTCGEGYMTQNSQREIFGIGQNEVVDSVEIAWTSGHVDKFYNIPANSTMEITEGSSSVAAMSYEFTKFCVGDSVLVTAQTGQNVLWSNGATEQSIYVSEPTLLSYSFENELGLTVISDEIDFSYFPVPDINLEAHNPHCAGASSGSEVHFAPSFEYDGIFSIEGLAVESPVLDLPEGTYELLFTSTDGCTSSAAFELAEPEELIGELLIEPILCFGEATTGQLTYSGGSGTIAIDWGGLDPDELYEGTVTVTLVDSLGCSLQLEEVLTTPQELSMDAEIIDAIENEGGAIDLTMEGGVEPYSFNWSGPENYTSTEEDPEDLVPGIYQIVVEDANGCTISSFHVVYNTVGVEEESAAIKIYPNPTDGILNLVFSDANAFESYQFFDAQGNLVKAGRLNRSTMSSIDMIDLQKGVYLIVLTTTNQTFTKLITKM